MTEEALAEVAAEQATPEASAGEGAQEQQPSGAETLLGKDAGEKPDESGADDAGKKEDDTEGQADIALELTVSDEFSAYADDFKAFQGEMAGWLKANPKATTMEALQAAANYQAKAVAAAQENITQEHAKQVKAWEKEARSLPDIGGDKFDENLGVAKAALDAFGSKELKALLDETGLGSNPHVISAFVKAGAALKSAPVAASGNPGVSDEHSLRNRYPSSQE